MYAVVGNKWRFRELNRLPGLILPERNDRHRWEGLPGAAITIGTGGADIGSARFRTCARPLWRHNCATISSMTEDTLLRFHALRQALVEEKAGLEQRIREITAVLGAATAGTGEIAPAVATTNQESPAPVKSKAKRAMRGALKEAIVAELQKAGTGGTSISAIAQALGVKELNVRAWFYATGKKIKNVKKVGRGVFGWKA